jgi:trimeric autotransporter adhesin
MKKNNLFKKTKQKLAVLMLLVCVLFGSNAIAQIDTFTLKIPATRVDNNWRNTANWTIARGAIPGTDTYPGETRTVDTVTIANDGNVVLGTGSNVGIGFLNITQNGNVSPFAASQLTIDAGVTLTCTNDTLAGNSVITLNGGKIINNGTLNVNTNRASTLSIITCGQQGSIVPTSPTTFGYSGTGFLNINSTGVHNGNSSFIAIQSTSVNHIYKFELTENKTTFTSNQTTTNSIFGFLNNGTDGIKPNTKLIIGGTGVTIASVATPSRGGLLRMLRGAIVEIESGTTLTYNATSTSTTPLIQSFHNAEESILTNKGTIKLQGASTANAINFSTGANAATAVKFTINNEGTLDVDMDINGLAKSPLGVSNGGGNATFTGASQFVAPYTGSGFYINNKSTGILKLKNSNSTSGRGFAMFTSVTELNTPRIFITNEGSMNLDGTAATYGAKATLVNTGTITSNNDIRSFTNFENSTAGVITFLKNANSFKTKFVTFGGITSANTAALGATYAVSGGATHTVVDAKLSGSNTLVTTVLANALVSSTGSLVKSTGTGTDPQGYTSATIGEENGALSMFNGCTNNGTINTGLGSDLGIINGITVSATGTIAPGGSAFKGIASYTGANPSILGTLALQVAGNATAGVQYDQITNVTTNGGFNITAATLNVTGISGTASPVDIIVANGTGTITGPFASVVGLTAGWSVNYGVTGKVQLVYTVSPSANTWNGSVSSSWTNASNWSAGVPNQNSDVSIVSTANAPVIASNVNINSLSIDTANLTVNSGFNLNVGGAITNINGGTVTVNSNANLIQGGTTNTNTGTVIVKRNSNALSLNDFTAWSSPVAAQNLLAFSPQTRTDRFNTYNEATDKYNVIASPSTTTMATATGYLIRMRGNAVEHPATETFEGVFTGVPNNGTIVKALTYAGVNKGYNLVGNPYPSTLDANSLIQANTANIENSLYFWRKRNAALGSAYAVYNPMGGTIASPTSAVPNGTIQVGQGFFVQAKSASNLTFTNAMRTANNANQTFKTAQVQKDRLWLNLTSTNDVFSQALVGYTAAATTGLDIYDAKYIGDSGIALTSAINNEEYSIQGRPSFDATDVVALNFKTDIATTENYTITLGVFDGVFATGQDVYLVDSVNGAVTDLKAEAYTFSAASGTQNNRFSLKFQKTLKVDPSEFNANNVTITSANGVITVNSVKTLISKIQVFNLQGRMIAAQNNVNNVTTPIKGLKAGQVLIVKVTGVNKAVVTRKVLN